MTKVFFRADASDSIGFGHFFRSLALSQMLSEYFDCRFFLHEPTGTQILQCGCSFPVIALSDRYEDFLNRLSGDEIVVLDNYFFNEDYRRKIKDKGCVLVCIDDFESSLSYADFTINHGFNGLGPQWALLRKPFRETVPARSDTKSSARPSLTVCFGGSDSLGLADSVAALLGECGMDVTVLHGSSRSAQQMAEIFRQSDFCILSASSVCYEALSCGCRVAAGWYVDNQKEFYDGLVGGGFVSPLGNLAESLPSREQLISALQTAPDPSVKWPSPEDVESRYVKLFQTLLCRRDYCIDGFEIINYTHLSLPQKLEILECRNDESVRKWMCNTDVISVESHIAYIEGLKNRDDAFYWGVYRDGVFCGGISLVDLNDAAADEGIFLNPALTGQGLGRAISEASFKLYFDIIGLRRIYSLVDKDNQAALKMDRALGFSVSECSTSSRFVRIEMFNPRRDG